MPEAAHILNSLPELTPAGLFFLIFFGTFVSEDAACLAAGSAVANGSMGFAAAVAACVLGIFVGDLLLFGVGRTVGHRVFTNAMVRRLVAARTIEKATSWITENAAAAVFLSRLVTGLRLPTYLAAGALRADAKKFAFYFLVAAAVWVPVLVGTVAFSQEFLFGGNTLLGALTGFILFRLALRFASWKNRRLLIGQLKRILSWEFWSVQVFYIPVVLYILRLAVRFRGLTVFTAANPAMPAGGFKGETKSGIYESIGCVSPDLLPAYTIVPHRLSPRARLIKAWRFMDDRDLSFPMIVKPDVGERGKGVRYVSSLEELSEALLAVKEDVLLQAVIAGVEASVFYYRRPGQTRGNIFSITEKRFPTIEGDGRRTVEELILSDSRAVCLAKKYFEQNLDQLARVLKKGEKYKLVNIGTHSRGAIFVDGGWLRTKALENKIDEVSRSIDGFYFGRYDLRAPSFDHMQRGDFTIIELNGVTSESTNIYDPRYSLAGAYRILFAQWRLAFEIGAENLRLGCKPTDLAELLMRAVGRKITANRTDRNGRPLSGEVEVF